MYPIVACQLLPYTRCILNGEQNGSEEPNLAILPLELKMCIISFLSDKKIMLMGKQEPLFLTAEHIDRLGLFASNRATIGKTRREFLSELGLMDIQACLPRIRL